MELTQIVEDRQAELETELRMCREILVILRGSRNKAKTGPIVYGNGYHGDRVLNAKGKPRKGPPTQGVKGLTTNKVVAIMKANPKGLTLEEIRSILAKKDGIQISTSSVYNAFRKQNVEKLAQPGVQAKAYRIVE